jgi:hypothetical protein
MIFMIVDHAEIQNFLELLMLKEIYFWFLLLIALIKRIRFGKLKLIQIILRLQ